MVLSRNRGRTTKTSTRSCLRPCPATELRIGGGVRLAVPALRAGADRGLIENESGGPDLGRYQRTPTGYCRINGSGVTLTAWRAMA